MIHELIISGVAQGKQRNFPSGPPVIEGKPGWEWLPVVNNKPTFDPTTHILSTPIINLTGMEITYNFTLTAKTFDDQSMKVIRAMADILVDEFNVLRDLHGLPDRTLQQFKNAIEARIPQ